MDKAELAEAIGKVAKKIGVDAGEIEVERPKAKEFGDWTSNLALKAAKGAGMDAREFAKSLAEGLGQVQGVAKAEVAGPGFVNIFLDSDVSAAIIEQILQEGVKFGQSDLLKAENINLEFVSANPTGPMHIGQGRWAAFGSSLANLLKFAGADVTKEYYWNDAGEQIRKLESSLAAAMEGKPIPEEGYQGSYISEAAKELKANSQTPSDGVELMKSKIVQSLENYGVHFDVFFNESSLFSSGEIDSVIAKLRKSGIVFDSEGASWFKASELGDSQDWVVIKSDGKNAYLASDIAYYFNKRARGFNKIMYILGADHHGYVGRLNAIAGARGDDPKSTLSVLIGQMVNLQNSRMSKRSGNIVFLDDLIEEVGKDAAFYSFARSNINRTLNLDIDQIKKQNADNPVYYVQYVHARCWSVEGVAADRGIELPSGGDIKFELLSAETEKDVVKLLASFEQTIEDSAISFAPYRICLFLEELAAAYHKWYSSSKILPPAGDAAEEIHIARLALNRAVRIIMNIGLESIIGISSPKRM